MKKYLISKKEKKELISYFKNRYNEDLSNFIKKNDIWLINDKYYVKDNNKIIFFKYNLEEIIPTIHLFAEIGYIFLPEVKVDEGAIKYILNGADIFRPGIIFFEKDIKKDNLVAIFGPSDNLLAIGKSLINYEDFSKIDKGKVIKNVHYYLDKIYTGKILNQK